MTCRELSDFIADYLSGELPDDVRAEFERHLQLCRNCRTYLAVYQTTVALGQRAFDDDDARAPLDAPEGLVRAILAARRRL